MITTSITDMGAITPILYEGLVPVFADVDRSTGNLTAGSIAARLGPGTSAVVVTHLFGRPCEMGAIQELLEPRGIPVVEDCAQAYLAEWQGRRVGTFGAINAFSMQQGKHMTSGEGGLVVTEREDLAERARVFVNKAWPYGRADPDHLFLALNYRLTELQGAVALGQLGKLEQNVRCRQETAGRLTSGLAGLEGLDLPGPPQDGTHAYWRYCIGVDPDRAGEVGALGARLRARGIACAPRYIQKPAFECKVLRDRLAGQEHPREEFPGTYGMLERALVLPWNEAYEEIHVQRIQSEIQRAVQGSGTE